MNFSQQSLSDGTWLLGPIAQLRMADQRVNSRPMMCNKVFDRAPANA
jgi:hypothetical protein